MYTYKTKCIDIPYEPHSPKPPLKRVIPHGVGKCHEVTKGTAQYEVARSAGGISPPLSQTKNVLTVGANIVRPWFFNNTARGVPRPP